MDLIIRALAILLVVLHHETLWPLPGGSAAMVILAGFSLARFQMGPLLAGGGLAILRPLTQILVPYYLIVGAYGRRLGRSPLGIDLPCRQFRFRRSGDPWHGALPLLVHRSLLPDDAGLRGAVRDPALPAACCSAALCDGHAVARRGADRQAGLADALADRQPADLHLAMDLLSGGDRLVRRDRRNASAATASGGQRELAPSCFSAFTRASGSARRSSICC